MNKTIQILLLCAVLPLGVQARKETLEERKQRIMRKYMREHAQVSDSELYVPSDQPEEDEKVMASETYGETKDMFERQEGVNMPTMPRRPMPMPRQTERSSWLLDDTELDEESDPYADPFALDKTDKTLDSKRSLSPWDRTQQDSSSLYGSSRDSRYGSSYESSYGRRQDTRGTQSRTYHSYLNQGTQDETDADTTSLYGSRETSPYGAQPGSSYSSGALGQQQESRTYGSTPSSGMLTPYPQLNSGYGSDSRQQGNPADRTRGYTPSYRTPGYTSPQDNNRSTYPAANTDNSFNAPAAPQVQRVPFEDWKKKQDEINPARSDAFGR